jgi:eukaryotic-like serine/threonine-protein kinase
MQPAKPPLPTKARAPQVLGRYEIIARLARGGMGTVYLARHAGEGGFQRLFALKVMHDYLAEDEAFVNMLRDEAAIAARLHHPNVVAVLDIGSNADTPFVVMEYVEGCALSSLLKHSPTRRPPELIVQVVIDTLEGLHSAHEQKDDDGRPLHLVHRDVSPQNILVGVDGTSRITDFGIAKAETRITSTQPGTRKGKLAYMAPEQFQNPEAVDHRADVFAAGAILWTALTGQPLFHGDSDGETLQKLMSMEIPPPSAVGLKQTNAFDEVCLTALARDREQRFATALDMADALRKAAIGAGLLGTKREVAAWVDDTFKAEFEQRRRAIRAATRRREGHEHTDVSLPSLPAISATYTKLSSSGTTDTSSVVSIADLGGSALTSAGSSSDVKPATTSLAAAPAATISEPPFARDKRKRGMFIIGGVALFALLGVGVLVLGRGGDSSATAAQPPATAQEPAPTKPVAEATKPEPAVTAPSAATTAAPGEPTTTAKDEPRSTGRRPSNWGKPLPKSGAAVAPPPGPAAPAGPVPTAADNGGGIERNPYMRHN